MLRRRQRTPVHRRRRPQSTRLLRGSAPRSRAHGHRAMVAITTLPHSRPLCDKRENPAPERLALGSSTGRSSRSPARTSTPRTSTTSATSRSTTRAPCRASVSGSAGTRRPTVRLPPSPAQPQPCGGTGGRGRRRVARTLGLGCRTHWGAGLLCSSPGLLLSCPPKSPMRSRLPPLLAPRALTPAVPRARRQADQRLRPQGGGAQRGQGGRGHQGDQRVLLQPDGRQDRRGQALAQVECVFVAQPLCDPQRRRVRSPVCTVPFRCIISMSQIILQVNTRSILPQPHSRHM